MTRLRKVEDFDLAGWVYDLRTRYNQGELSKERIDILESIPGWSWSPFDKAWEIGFATLKKYGVVSRSFRTKDGYTLGRWIDKQTRRCDDPERRKRLESIPGWSWNRRDEEWEEGFKLLKKHGCNIKFDFVTKDGFKLGQWFEGQMLRCKDSERRKRLESIPGWTWERNKKESQWQRSFAVAKKTGVVSRNIVVDGLKVGVWCSDQRHKCKDPERRKLLESIPGWRW